MSKRRERSSPPPALGESNDPCVIIVAGDTESPEQHALRIEALDACGRVHVRVLKTIRLASHRVTHGAERDRLLPLVAPEDARWMYAELHRYDVAVLTLRAAYVRRDPSMLPARRRQLLPLVRFVRYKAFYAMIRSRRDIEVALDQFAESRRTVGCDGVDDPRVLPLHIFHCPNDWTGLDSAAGRTIFDREHGNSNHRYDCSGLYWAKPKGQAARHGGSALRVARRTLESGFHWDVSAARRATVYSADSVWLLRQSNSYINIYPNGHIRPPGKGYGTVRVWPA